LRKRLVVVAIERHRFERMLKPRLVGRGRGRAPGTGLYEIADIDRPIPIMQSIGDVTMSNSFACHIAAAS